MEALGERLALEVQRDPALARIPLPPHMQVGVVHAQVRPRLRQGVRSCGGGPSVGTQGQAQCQQCSHAASATAGAVVLGLDTPARSSRQRQLARLCWHSNP